MDFKEVTLRDRVTIDGYMMKYGEGSCQHSFMAMLGMQGKYGDVFCEDNGVLYVLRRGLSNDDSDAFLVPMGLMCESDEGMIAAVEKIMDHAHKRDKKIAFNTLTEDSMKRITGLFPGKFAAEEARDSFEYIHTFEDLAYMRGAGFSRRRQDINSFNRIFGDRTQIKTIDADEICDIRDFQIYWNDDHTERCLINGRKTLQHEHEGIMKILDAFGQLPVSGIVIRVEGVVRGYAYGTVISNGLYDVLVEKGDRGIRDIYRPLNTELVKMCASGHRYINREEDCGDLGLRASKLSLMPEFFLKKYIVSEV